MSWKRGRTTKATSAGAGCGVVFGLGWTAFTLVFAVLVLQHLRKVMEVRGWDEVPCQLERFEIHDEPDDDPPFRAEVEFVYQVEGRWHRGTRLFSTSSSESTRDDKYSDLVEIRELAKERQEAGHLNCWVNPSDADEAVLAVEEGELGRALLMLLFVGVFVSIGVGVTVASILAMRSNRARTAGAVRRKSPVRKDRGVRVVAWATSVIGIVWVISFSGKWQEALNARSWVKTPAEVIWSRVREQDSDDGTTYSVDIFYRYTYEGQEYRSNRRRLISSSSSGRASKQAEVDAHPPGQAISCWVDPGHPDRAVLERGWVFHGVMAAVAVAILLTSMGCWWRVLGGPSDGDASRRLRENENRKGLGREVRDGSLRRRWTSLTVALLTAGFWNGLVSVFVGVAWKAWKGGNPEWFLMLFLIPFVGIGIFLLGAVVVQGVALFSPRYGVELEKVSLRPGEDTALQWMRTGGVGTPRRLRIWLVGREEATYQRGSSTTTARETFFEQELFATEAPLRMREGRLTVTIPAGGMPSLRTPHNKLRWFAVLGVETPRMPAVLDEYEIDVVP